MRMFIPSVLSALEALLKCPRWFLWKVLKVFIGWKESKPPQGPASDSYSPHDSNGIPSQRRLLPTHRHPPQSRPADGDYTAPSQSPHYQTPLQSYRPRHQPNQSPTGATPLVPPNTSVTRLFESTQQSSSIITAPPATSHEDYVSPGRAARHEIIGPMRRSQQKEDLSQPQRPAGLQDHCPPKDHHSTVNRPASETQVLHPDREQSQYDRTQYQDQDQLNQHNEHYTSLRAKAKQEGDEMAQCFQQSHEAYMHDGHALAKQLSEQGKLHRRTMEALNAEANAWIFRENNLDSKPGELNLHGLYVNEATSHSEKAIEEARQRGDSQIRFIVGKGRHSKDNMAKIKPAIEDLLKQHNLPAEIDPQNEGVLIVQLA